MTMTPFERRSVWLTTAGTLITGLAYWWMKEMMVSTDPWSVVNHPLQPWMLKAHILIAPFLVFSVGLITSRHIWRHFTMGVAKGRRSGLVAATMFALMVLSGYALQVITAETLMRALAWGHLGLGIVYSVGVAAHFPATRSRQEPAAASPQRREQVAGVGTVGAGGGRMPAHERRRRTRRRDGSAKS